MRTEWRDKELADFMEVFALCRKNGLDPAAAAEISVKIWSLFNRPKATTDSFTPKEY